MKNHCAVLFLGAALSGCGSYSVKAPESISVDPQIKGNEQTGPGMDSYLAFNAALKASQNSPQDGPANALLLHEGMELVTANCMKYFTRLGTAEQQLRFASKETALSGGVIASAQGLANASAKSIANTASIFGFATASMNAYSDTYIFSPEVKAVQALVLTAMESSTKVGRAIAQGATTGIQTLSYTEVNSFLLTMESNCQPHGIRDLVTRAVANQKAVPASAAEGLGDQSSSQPVVTQALEQAESAARDAYNAAVASYDTLKNKIGNSQNTADKSRVAAAMALRDARKTALDLAQVAVQKNKDAVEKTREQAKAAGGAQVAASAAANGKAVADGKAAELEKSTPEIKPGVAPPQLLRFQGLSRSQALVLKQIN